MYLIANSSAHMSAGKLAAQAAHAAVEAYRISDQDILSEWYVGGHYMKVVLEADDLTVAERYIRDRGFDTVLIIDEGRTEFKGLTPTFIGVEVLDKDDAHVKATFGEFKLAGTRRREEREARKKAEKMADALFAETPGYLYSVEPAPPLTRAQRAIERMKKIRL